MFIIPAPEERAIREARVYRRNDFVKRTDPQGVVTYGRITKVVLMKGYYDPSEVTRWYRLDDEGVIQTAQDLEPVESEADLDLKHDADGFLTDGSADRLMAFALAQALRDGTAYGPTPSMAAVETLDPREAVL